MMDLRGIEEPEDDRDSGSNAPDVLVLRVRQHERRVSLRAGGFVDVVFMLSVLD